MDSRARVRVRVTTGCTVLCCWCFRDDSFFTPNDYHCHSLYYYYPPSRRRTISPRSGVTHMIVAMALGGAPRMQRSASPPALVWCWPRRVYLRLPSLLFCSPPDIPFRTGRRHATTKSVNAAARTRNENVLLRVGARIIAQWVAVAHGTDREEGRRGGARRRAPPSSPRAN